MAHLPAKTNELAPEAVESIGSAIAAGHSPAEIARKLYPTDKRARKAMRMRIWRMGAKDDRLARYMAERAKATVLFGLVPMTEALVRRGSRGNVMAIKLAYEASGYHNPKVQHEHSGEVTIKLDMPRPNYEAMGGVIEDADVVEE